MWAAVMLFLLCAAVVATAQYYKPQIAPPPPPPQPVSKTNVTGATHSGKRETSETSADTAALHSAASPIIPLTYEQLLEAEQAPNLATPSNIKTEAEYDPATNCYVIRTRIGDMEVATPFIISEKCTMTGSHASQ